MLVVISDLHLEETASTRINGLHFDRNLDPWEYECFIKSLANQAKIHKAKEVVLVLAGDILELHRTPLWFENGLRPYIDNNAVTPGSPYEKKVLEIIEAITSEPKVDQTIQILRNMQQHFDVETKLQYVLGNHDRLINATPKIRQRIRQLFGISDQKGSLLPNYYIHQTQEGPLALVRHGHEYDQINFTDIHIKQKKIPLDIPVEHYQAPSLGDFLAVDFSSRLPFLYKQYYGSDILKDETLMALYTRLIDFEDVRPISALLNFLFATPGVKKKEVWRRLEPVFKTLLDEFNHNQFLLDRLQRVENVGLSQTELIKGIIQMRIWRSGIPYWVVKTLTKNLRKKVRLPKPEKHAASEAILDDKNSPIRCIIGGHSHFPQVSLLSVNGNTERYYINTGTWRNLIPSTPKHNAFGHLKTRSQVYVYGPTENNNGKSKDWSFEYSSGYSQ